LIRLAFILLVMIHLKGFGQSQILLTLSNSPGEVTPGGHFTLFFDVKSSSTLDAPIQETLILPEKWTLLSQRKPEPVSGQKELRYFFVVGTPSDCSSGEYPVSFEFSAGGQGFSKSIPITIKELRKVEIFVVSQPEFVKEGDTLRVEYLIQNAGNRSEKILLKTGRGRIENLADSMLLKPNAKTRVTISQTIPFTENNAWQSSSDLTAVLSDGEHPVYQVVTIPVFSSKIKKIDRYFRFPVEIGGGYLSYTYGGRNMSAYQYLATGRGFVDQKEKHYLDFTVRGPNQFVFPAIGSYDQYSLDYQFKRKTFVSFGDYVLQLNNLMEFGRFGRGVKVEQQFRKIGYALFYQKARFYFNQKESAGGKISYKLGGSSNLAVSYLSKNVIYRNVGFWSRLIGVSGTIRTKDIQLETELAGGRALGKSDYGAFMRLQITKRWLSVSGNFIYAGKNFYGFYNNSLLINSNIGFNISQKITWGINGNFSNVNPSLDANLYSTSPKDRSYMTFLSYQLNAKNRFFVFYAIQEREDRQKPSQFNYAENFGNISYTLSREKFSVFYQGRYGSSYNRLVADNSGRKESFSNLAQPSFRIFSWIWLGGYMEYQHTSKFSNTNVIQHLFFYGGNARISLKKNLFASFMYRNNYAPDELYEKRSYMDASVLLDLKRHRFTLTGGSSYIPNMSNAEQNTLFFSLKYALKIDVPLSRKRNIGTVKGRLTGSGFSKEGNLIQLGSHKFLTDSTGLFSFEGIAPDQYFLSINQNASRNDGVVPGLRMPLFVHVKPDSLHILEIPFTRTGCISGKVDFLKPGQAGLSSVFNQRPTVLIKLANETSSFLTELNDKDEFSFKEMKPGNWTLSAFIPGNQDRFVIEENQIELDIETDKTMKIVFKVRPNEKRIHFSEKTFDLSIKK